MRAALVHLLFCFIWPPVLSVSSLLFQQSLGLKRGNLKTNFFLHRRRG
jgi:hypothetical protein